MKRFLAYTLFLAAGCGAWFWVEANFSSPLKEPVQTPTTKAAFSRNGCRIIPQAEFSADVRIFSKKRYQDDKSSIAPLDLAVGWGPAASELLFPRMLVEQQDRYSYFSGPVLSPLSWPLLMRYLANMHIIPANAAVEATIARAGRGDSLSLRGYLVNLDSDQGWAIETSLTRTDTGEGACEIFYVEEAKPFPSPTLAAAPKPTPVALPAAQDRPTPPAEIVLKREITVPLQYGQLVVPAGAKVEYRPEKGGELNASYQGFRFTLPPTALR